MLGYRGILGLACVGLGLALFLLFVSWIRQKRQPYKQKLSTYECGFDTFEGDANSSKQPFQVSFYRVGLLFVLFDLEIAFLLPFAVSIQEIGWQGFLAIFTFLAMLTLGFVYEWHKGALQWIR